MNLAFIHGPPATGNYTIGRELAALTGYELYHNHLVVDQVLRQHAFGTPEFVELRDRMWREYFERVAREQPAGVIFTFSPEKSVPQAFIDWFFHDLAGRQVRILSVALTASEAAIERRLATDQRKQFRKLSDRTLYRQLRAAGDFTAPVIPRTDLLIDTEKVSPLNAARLISSHLGPCSSLEPTFG